MLKIHPQRLALTTLFSALATSVFATQLAEVSPVDEQVIMVHFRDGEVVFRDDGAGPGANAGHELGEDADELVPFGQPLDLASATATDSWTLASPDDERYGTAGVHPTSVHRKAKVLNSTHNWAYCLDHWVFLRLPHALKPGARYQLAIDPGTASEATTTAFTFDLETSRSEAIHVDLIGYTPHSPVKAADLYLWLGDGGPRDYSAFEGRRVWLHDVKTRESFPAGAVKFWKKARADDAGKRNLTGSPVWNIDFSDFSRPGHYRLVVEGVGCSAEFAIRDEAMFEPFKTSVRGYYYMRVGEPAGAVTPTPRQPRFIPGEDPAEFTIYRTSLTPSDRVWKEHQGDIWDEPHFKRPEESLFWHHRLPGNPTTTQAVGGHSDALDWDRHLGHVSNIYDLLLPYLLTNGKLGDDDLAIRESGNGIPDLIDEARNEVDLWLSVRDGEAYCHGLTNPTRDHTTMFQAGATAMAAWANAANCAMLADAFRVAKIPTLLARYRDEAIKAYRFASAQPADRQQLDERQEIGDAYMRGRDFRVTAAAFLYNITGEREWEDVVAAESVCARGPRNIEQGEEWSQIFATAAYLNTPHPQRHRKLAKNMRTALRKQALDDYVRHADDRPSRRSTHSYWRTAENLDIVVLAHAFSADPKEKERLARALILEADWGLGRNPSNLVEMTGLGSRCVENCYTSGRNDGTPGLHPGHTPYNNIDPWGGPYNGSNPRWFSDRGYPAWETWPQQESYFNSRYCWANGEFTPRQTMRGKMALYGYLLGVFGRSAH